MLRISTGRLSSLFVAVLMAASLMAVTGAEARMGGSFGSRGMRTFHSAPVTRTAPNMVSPIQRSMTSPNTGTRTNAPATPRTGGYGNWRPGLWGFGGGLLGGLVGGLFLHGLFGSVLGYGFGGFGGGLVSLLQIALLGLVAYWLFRRFSGRRLGYDGPGRAYESYEGYNGPTYRQPPAGAPPAGSRAGAGDEIGITDADLEAFENRLAEVQDAFSREDHAALRRLTTPEMVSYLSEELAENAAKGVRNDVKDVKFVQGDVAEAWREGEREYATVAFKWSAIDVMRRRDTGELVKGDAETPAVATELWTFVRDNGGEWRLSAIQEA